MKSLLLRSLSVSFLTLGLTVLANQTVKAAIINYSFTVSSLSGVLQSNTYKGILSYDNSSLTGGDSESTSLISFFFPFQGKIYTLADDLSATADFSSNNFLGANFSSTDSSFSFSSGFFTSNINDASFSYDLKPNNIGPIGAGYGSVTYVPESLTILQLINSLAPYTNSLVPYNTSVPEPSVNLATFGSVLLLGVIKWFKKKA